MSRILSDADRRLRDRVTRWADDEAQHYDSFESAKQYCLEMVAEWLDEWDTDRKEVWDGQQGSKAMEHVR